MGVTMVIGRAGSGKTYRCFTRIVDAMRTDPLGPPIYWIVPRQSTFSLERMLTCESGLGAFTRCRVVSFEQLAEEVLAAFPGPTRAVVSPLGRLATMAHLLRAGSGELEHFQRSAGRPGLAAEVLDILDELSRNGSLTPDDTGTDALDRAAGNLTDDGTHPGLAGKLADLRRLRDAYRQFMGPGRFDKDSRLEHVLRHTAATPNFRGASFYVDGFLDLLDFERRMLGALAQSASDAGTTFDVTFSLPTGTPGLDNIDLLPAEDGVFHRIESAHRALRLLLRERGIPVRVERLEGARRFVAAGIAAVEAAFAEPSAKLEGSVSAGVEFTAAPDRRSEVDAVARRILQLTRDPAGPGYRQRDIVVLTRNLADYESHLAASFADHGIGHFLDRRRDASSHPLLRLVRAALSLGTTGWNTGHIVAMCKSGLVGGCGVDVACRLENHAKGTGLEGEMWNVARSTTPPDLEALRVRLLQPLGAWIALVRLGDGVDPPPTLRAAVVGLLSLLDGLGVPTELAGLIAAAQAAGDEALAAEHTQVWTEFTEFLGELADLLGTVAMSAEDLIWIFTAAFDALNLGLTPPTVDQVVIGQAERTRVTQAKAVLVLGLSERMFPPAHEDSAMLSDRERSTLASARLHLDASADRRQLDEHLIAYLAVSRASELLHLSRPTTDGRGAPLGESPYWQVAQRAVGAAAAETVVDPTSPENIATETQLAEALLRWARRQDSTGEDAATHAGLYQHVAMHPAEFPIVSAVWPALRPVHDRITLPPDLADKLFPQPLALTDRQVETFAKCPFRHHAEFTLKIADLAAPHVTGRTLSGLYHRVLREFTELLVKRHHAAWDGLPPEESAREVERLAQAATAREVVRLTYDGSADPAKLAPSDRYALTRVAGALDELVRAHRAAAPRTTFTPQHAAAKFGLGERFPPLTLALAGGKTATISGSIDRVDISQADTLAAWDYTLSPHPPSLAKIYHGLSVRLPIHLLVLRDAGTVAGAFGLPLPNKMKSFSSIEKYLQSPATDSEEFLLERRRARGLLSDDSTFDFDNTVEKGGKSAIIAYARTKDGPTSQAGTDVLAPNVFAAMLDHARETLENIASGIAAGTMDVTPFKLGNTSACVDCTFQAACRFNPREGGHYVHLTPTKAGDIRDLLRAPAPTVPPPKTT